VSKIDDIVFTITCECGSEYKSKIKTIHSTGNFKHVSDTKCPGCGDYDNFKKFRGEL